LALGYDDGGLILLDAVSGVPLHEAETGEPISAVAFSLDGRHLLAGDAAGKLTLRDSATGDALASWDVHDSYVTGLAISPDGERLTTVSADGRGYIIAFETLLKQQNHADGPHAGGDLPLEATLATLIGHDDLIVSLHSSPDGLRMVTASWDGTAIIWDARNGEPLMTLEGHQGQVMDAAFSPDGARIASVGADGDVIFWDALTGAKLFVLASLDTPLRSLDFDHDGRFLAVAGEDGSVRVYAPLLDDLIMLAESRLTRPLSAAECQLYLHQEICP
jgi:WD40 repeat protein